MDRLAASFAVARLQAAEVELQEVLVLLLSLPGVPGAVLQGRL
jgi:hypothetical protein